MFSERLRKVVPYAIFCTFLLVGCSEPSENQTSSQKYEVQTLKVMSTGYTSSPEETTPEGGPFTTAWGDTLEPGMKAIAVSHDLIPMGLTHKTRVKILGLKGEYKVLDKMNRRWTQKIDIYFGLDKEAAKEWGKRPVTIVWQTPKKQ
ncbi:MAG: 3D domain-containing protein [Desulfovibrio sp.]|uniref:3D domain-containing protein n=1 Tax=Desulfovibrio sp. 7SRBS1 TaxID=3378064 RepID=UPI003B40EFFE